MTQKTPPTLSYVTSELQAVIEGMKNGEMKLQLGSEITNACGKIISAAKAEIDAVEVKKRYKDVEFSFLPA